MGAGQTETSERLMYNREIIRAIIILVSDYVGDADRKKKCCVLLQGREYER